jgi:hypothetical protein
VSSYAHVSYSTPLNALNLCSSLNVKDQVSYLNNITGKIIVLHVLIFMFLTGKWIEKDSRPNGSKNSPN